MKPRLIPAAPTIEDVNVLYSLAMRQRFRVFGPGGILRKIRESDSRDADLMLALTGWPCGEHGICTAELFAAGCIIHNSTARTRVAIRAYEGQSDRHQDGITYFA